MDTLIRVGLANAAGAAVLALVALAGGRLRRPALSHALWLLVLLKLVTPPIWPVAVPWPAEAPATPGVLDTSAAAPPELVAIAADTPPPSEWTGPSWQQAAAIIWLAGSLLWWGLAAWRVRGFGKVLTTARPAPAALAARVERLAGRMGLKHCPAVALVPGQISPLLWALGRRPRLLLPNALWPRLAPEQQDTLLAHELAHLRRRDHWVRRLELLALGLYWWFPVAWWARRQLQDAEEECCDAWVIAALPDSAPAFASALLETVAFLSSRPTTLPAAATAIGHVRFLKRRLTMILLGTTPRRLSWPGLIAVLALAAVLPLVPTWAEPAAAQPVELSDPIAVSGGPAEHDEALAVLRKLEQSCRSCHSAIHEGHAKVAQDKWQELHNQAAQVWQELARMTPSPGRADPQQALQSARDEVELQQALLAVKHAQMEAVKVSLHEAAKRGDTLSRANKLHPGSIPMSDLSAAMADVAKLQADLRVREAELLEPQVRLRQAERRLAALQKYSHGPEKREDPGERLRRLNAELKRLLDEIKTLQEELQK